MAIPSNWAAYLGDGTATGGVRDGLGTTQEGWHEALKWVQKYDPTASLQVAMQPGGEAGQYLQFNNKLLPQNVTGGRGIEGIARLPGSGEKLVNGGAVFEDPNFGRVTFPQNLAEKGPSLVDIIGPLIVGAATMGGGLAGLAPGMASAGFDLAGSGAFAAGGSGTFGAGAGAYGGSVGQMIQRLMSQGPRALSGATGGGQARPNFSPGQLMLLRLFAARQAQGGGG